MLPAFVACQLLRRSRLGEVSPKTKKGPRLAGRGAPLKEAEAIPALLSWRLREEGAIPVSGQTREVVQEGGRY